MRATFKGGYTLAFYKADVTTGDAQETWHNQPNDALVRQPRQRRAWRAISSSSSSACAAVAAAEADAAAEAKPPRRRAAAPGSASRHRKARRSRWTNGIATTRSTSWMRPRARCC